MTSTAHTSTDTGSLKSAADIGDVVRALGVDLRPAGASLKGCCPFHSERTPSFFVHPAKGYFKCHGCGEGGDVLEFVQKHERLTFPEAVAWLERFTGIQPGASAVVTRREPPLPKEPDQIPFEEVAAGLDPKHRPANSLWQYLAGCFTAPVADALFEKYRVGTSKHFRLPSGHMAALLLQTDVCGRVRHAKAMIYDPATGKRNKSGQPCQRWNKDRNAYADFTDRDAIEFLGKTILGNPSPEPDLRQCLFGEHLLFTEQKPVAIVESERTAMFCAAAMPELVWLATGSKGGMKQLAIAEKVACLAGRTVFLFPDNDGFEEWVKDAAAVQAACPTASVFVNDYLKRATAGKPEFAKADIEDFLASRRDSRAGWVLTEPETDKTAHPIFWDSKI